MPAREETVFPLPESAEKRFSGKKFIDERADNKAYEGFHFEFCTLEKIGLKDTVFLHCTFKHCDFADCYMVGATFEHCNFVGSFFERTNFSWAKFPKSQLDYTRFSHCAPVLSQIMEQRPSHPQAAAKFFRNLAAEQKDLGNWQEVDRLIKQSYKERERHYWFAATGANAHYKEKYGGAARFTYAFRYLFSILNGFIWGYGVSWSSFAKSVVLFWLILFPVANGIFGTLKDRSSYFWTEAPISDIVRYVSLLYRTTTLTFYPFIPSSTLEQSDLKLPFFLVSVESILGTVFIALFASLVFRAASKGV